MCIKLTTYACCEPSGRHQHCSLPIYTPPWKAEGETEFWPSKCPCRYVIRTFDEVEQCKLQAFDTQYSMEQVSVVLRVAAVTDSVRVQTLFMFCGILGLRLSVWFSASCFRKYLGRFRKNNLLFGAFWPLLHPRHSKGRFGSFWSLSSPLRVFWSFKESRSRKEFSQACQKTPVKTQTNNQSLNTHGRPPLKHALMLPHLILISEFSGWIRWKLYGFYFLWQQRMTWTSTSSFCSWLASHLTISMLAIAGQTGEEFWDITAIQGEEIYWCWQ